MITNAKVKKVPKNEESLDDIKNEVESKNEDNPKNYGNPRNQDDPKSEKDPKNEKVNEKWRWPQ